MTLRCRLLPSGDAAPLVSNQGGELPGIIVFLGRRGEAFPHGTRQRLVSFERINPLSHGLAPSVVSVAALAAFDQVVNGLAETRPEQVSVRLRDHVGQAKVLGMIGDDQEVERTLQARAQPRVGSDLFASGKTIGLVRTEAVPNMPASVE